MLRALGISRSVFCRAASALAPKELAEDTIERFESVIADLVDAVIAVYQSTADEAARAFAKLDARYRERYQRTPAMMHSLDAEMRISAVSDRGLATLEYTADEALGRRSVDFFTEESRRRALDIILPRLSAEGEVFDVPYQLVKKSGKIIDVRASSVAVRDEQGNVTQLLSVLEDVTAEVEATRALREREERWRALIELSPLPLCVHRDGTLRWMNDATVRTFFAEALVRVAKSIRLLGAEVVITGITPPIARALVMLGADFGRLTTCGTLRDGIAQARGLRGGRSF